MGWIILIPLLLMTHTLSALLGLWGQSFFRKRKHNKLLSKLEQQIRQCPDVGRMHEVSVETTEELIHEAELDRRFGAMLRKERWC